MSEYENNDKSYLGLHFRETSSILEASKRLKLSSEAFYIACSIYHRFYERTQTNLRKRFDDGKILGPTALYLAAKANEEPVKIRDVVNVFYRILHENELPLEIGDKYWQLRDSIQHCELFVLRILDFQVSFDSPQKYLLNYLNSLKSWVDPQEWNDSLVTQISWNLLQDSCHLPLSGFVKPDVISLAVIMTAVSCTNLHISTEGTQYHWWQAFNKEITESDLQTIATRILQIYQIEHN